MKNLYLKMQCLAVFLFVAAIQTSAQQSLHITFNGDDAAHWTTQNNSTYEVSNGHLVCQMGLQSNSKYRGDFKFNNDNDADINFTLTPAKDIYLAVKFIDTRPHGALKLEFNDGSQWLNSKWNGGSPSFIETSSGNYIYYFKLNDDDKYTGDQMNIRRMNFIIADCAEEPYSYTLDWVATFQSLEELEAYKNAKDDGENDADDVEEVVMSNVLNQTTGKGYAELSEALTDAADHDVLVLNTDITVTSRINIEKPLTLIAGTEGATISRGEGYLGGLVILTRTGGDLTLGGSGGSLILDGCNLLSTSNFIEASNGATTTLHSQVVMRNCVSTSVLGPAICNKSNGKLVLDGATFENCRTVNVNGETIADKGVVFVGTGITLSGNNTFVNCGGADIFIEGNRTVDAQNATHTEPILCFVQDPTTRTTAEVILNYTDAANMVLLNDGYIFASDGTNLVFAIEEGTGIVNQVFAHDLLVSASHGQLIITSSLPRTLNLYRADGVLIRKVSLQQGENVIDNLSAGFYVIGNKKIAL